MISKAEILAHAKDAQLTPEVVEKDYVLGWLLFALGQHPEAGELWAFKGGTCLKKCVIETWRFSEDLDFTLLPGAGYTAVHLRGVLAEVTALCSQESGLAFPSTGSAIRERRNRQGQLTFEASVEYRGPLVFPGSPKIRLDLTQHEPVLRPVQRRAIVHPYSDGLPANTSVNTYALGELVAEKARALWERTRPRDLYDVVLLGTLSRSPEESRALRELASEKFAAKGLSLPTATAIVEKAQRDAELRSEWASMLAHQLPALPSLDEFLSRLPDALSWLSSPTQASQQVGTLRSEAIEGPAAVALESLRVAAGEAIVRPSRERRERPVGSLDVIQFAGAGRLLLQFTYHGHQRVVEPYSLRRPRTGTLLLYGFEQRKNGVPTSDVRAYKVDELQSLRVLEQSYRPRYVIELNEQEGVWTW
jgi:predicted nucleotidyltransferase component of viral defense system